MTEHKPCCDLIYRCTACGKWSHAKRKPKHHQRFISADDFDGPGDWPVLSVAEGFTDYTSGEGTSGGWWIACGPFETWEAKPA